MQVKGYRLDKYQCADDQQGGKGRGFVIDAQKKNDHPESRILLGLLPNSAMITTVQCTVLVLIFFTLHTAHCTGVSGASGTIAFGTIFLSFS